MRGREAEGVPLFLWTFLEEDEDRGHDSPPFRTVPEVIGEASLPIID